MAVIRERPGEVAQANLVALAENQCPGDGFVVGLDETGGNLIAICWLMRGSPGDERKLTVRPGYVFTDFGLSSGKGGASEPYHAMRDLRFLNGSSGVISGNGSQTDNYGMGSNSLEEAMEGFSYKNDAPHFTPRITAMVRWKNESGSVSSPRAYVSVLRRSRLSAGCDRALYEPSLAPGLGYCIHTYREEGRPLPAFEGGPYCVPVGGGLVHTARMFWNALNHERLLALAVKYIPRDGGPPHVVIY